jgi:hypothetical protein
MLSPWADFQIVVIKIDHLCDLVVRAPSCKPGGLGFDSRRYQIFCIAVEQDPVSLLSINE